MLYTTLDSLKDRLGVTDTSSDTGLSLIIERASSIIESEIGDISEKTITERVDGNGHDMIYTKLIPNSIESVKTVDGYSYSVDFWEGYIIYLKEKACKRKKGVLVKYATGFATVPGELEEICLDLCTIFVSESGLDINTENLIDKNIKTKKLGDLMITYFGENEKSFSSKDILHPAKNIHRIFQKYKKFTGLYK